MPTRTRIDRFGDTWKVQIGPEARRLRKEIEAEQEAALARYDLDPSPENREAFAAIADTEGEIARRIEPLPRVVTRPVEMDPSVWGFDSREAMEAAFRDEAA